MHRRHKKAVGNCDFRMCRESVCAIDEAILGPTAHKMLKGLRR